MRRVLRIAGAVVLALLLLPALIFALVQTPPGRAWLAATIARIVADPGEHITVTGLEGLIPFDMSLARVEVSDQAGPRVVVADAALVIAPADLLRGRLTVRQFHAGDIEVLRPSPTPIHIDPALLMHPPLAVRLGALHIDRLFLGAPLVGEAVAARVDGSAALGGGRAAAELDIRGIDATPGEARLRLALSGTPPRLDLAADIAEPSGKLLADALGSAAPVPVSLHLEGDGPLTDWQGKLSLRAGAATAEAQLKLRRDGGYHVAATGEANVASLLPPRFRPLLEGPLDASTAIDIEGERIALTRFSLEDKAARLVASGSIARGGDESLAGESTLELPDLAALAPLIGTPAQGAARLALSLGGTRRAPRARMMLTGERLGLSEASAQTAAATVDLGATGDPLDPATPIEVSASGDLGGLALGAAALPGGLGTRLDWRLGARLDRAAQRLEVHALELDDAGSSLAASAAGNAAGIAGEAMLRVPDIGRFAGAGTGGVLALAADFRAAGDGSATAVVSGTLAAPHSGIGPVDRLLGAEARLSGTLRRAADGTLAASEVALEGADLRLGGEASLGATGALEGTWQLALPRLQALDPSFAGAAMVSGTLGGSKAAPAATATLTADRVAAGALHLDRIDAHLAVADLLHPSARMEASFRRGDLRGTLTAEGARAGTTLRIDRFRLDAAQTRVDGALALRLDSGTVDGTLAADVPDLKPWSALLDSPLAGSAKLDARLNGSKGQSVELTLDGKALSFAGTRLQQLHAQARLGDVLGAPTGRGRIEIDQAVLGKASVTRLTLDGASERPGRYALTLSAQGKASEAYRVTARARLGLERGGATLDLDELAGNLGSAPVRLRQPLQLTRRDGTLAFANLDLAFGEGRFSGDGSVKGAALALHLKAAALPVHRLGELAGFSEVSGTLGFEVTLSGTRARPAGRFVLDAEQVQLSPTTRPDLSPLGLVVSADWRDGVVDAKGRLAGPHNAALGFTGRAPLVLEPQRLALRLPPQGALALHLEGDGELADLTEIAPLGEDRVAGHFTVDVSVAGTVAAPDATGRLSVRNGRYESLYWGTTLTGMSFDLVGSHDRLVLRDFRASDGAKGALNLTGAVNLAGMAGPNFAFSGSFRNFQAVQRDEATAVMSGDVQLSGTIAAPRLGARLTINHAELRVPERLPQNVQPIPVTVIDSTTGQVLSTPQQSPQHVALLSLALDVNVDLPGQVFVRGRGLDSQWRGHLAITGTTAAPSIDGKLEVVRGSYNFLGKNANLSSGTITFLGGQRINPEIDIEARVSSTDVIAIIRITGTATEPKIALTSQPELPQDEILARVLFGTSVSSISPVQGLEIAQAAAALATGGNPGVLDRIRQGLGLDRLSLNSASATSPLSNVSMPTTPAGVPSAFPTAGIGSSPTPIGAASSSSPVGDTTVSAGKYVANGVYVGVTQGVGAGSSAVNVQVDVTPHISIDTTAGGALTGTGVGINWKLDY